MSIRAKYLIRGGLLAAAAMVGLSGVFVCLYSTLIATILLAVCSALLLVERYVEQRSLRAKE